MNRYAVFRVSYSAYGVSLWSSQSDALESVLADIKRLVPSARVDNLDNLPTGERFMSSVKNLGGNDFGVAWWIIRQLCDSGWEPFAYQYDQPSHTYHLRLEIG